MKLSNENKFILLGLFLLPFLLTGTIVYLLFRSLVPSLNDLKDNIFRIAQDPSSISEADKEYFDNLMKFAVHFSMITWIAIIIFALP